MLDSAIYCITDLETTGLDFRVDYPIEVGCIFTDQRFRVLQVWHTLIRWPWMRSLVGKTWPERFQEAFAVHGITTEEVLRAGKPPREVVKSLLQTCDQLVVAEPVILLSDNSIFEFNFMRKLFGSDERWPFNYHVYDASLLFRLLKIEKVKKRHRAMSDAHQLYHSLLKAYKRIESFGTEGA